VAPDVVPSASPAAVRFVRGALGIVVVGAVAGMIACAATKHLGGVVALGLVSSAAVAGLMLQTWLVGSGGERRPASADAETRARAVEARVGVLVAAGANEADVRALAGEAVALGRATGR
jgi:uncharacterized membrane protein YeaQ/YmgE (transglycosylase-associated protein family)